MWDSENDRTHSGRYKILTKTFYFQFVGFWICFSRYNEKDRSYAKQHASWGPGTRLVNPSSYLDAVLAK